MDTPNTVQFQSIKLLLPVYTQQYNISTKFMCQVKYYKKEAFFPLKAPYPKYWPKLQTTGLFSRLLPQISHLLVWSFALSSLRGRGSIREGTLFRHLFCISFFHLFVPFQMNPLSIPPPTQQDVKRWGAQWERATHTQYLQENFTSLFRGWVSGEPSKPQQACSEVKDTLWYT